MSFARDSLRTVIARIIVIFFNMLAAIINARWLGPEGIGVYALLLLVSSFAFRFGNLGFGSAFAFFVARKKASSKTIIKLAMLISIALSIMCPLFILIIWKYDFSPWNDIRAPLLYTSLILIPIMYFKNFSQRILSGQLRIKAINISEVIGSVGYISMLVFLVIFLQLGVFGTLFAYISSQTITLVYLLYQFRNIGYELSKTTEMQPPPKKLLVQLWSYGRWNYLIMFANFFLEELPLILLKYFFANMFVGLFSVARGLSSKSRVIMIEPFSNVLFPFTAASNEDGAVRRTNILCRNSMLLMFCVSLVSFLSIGFLIRLFYGEAFIASTLVFYALLPGMFIYPLDRFLVVHVAASGNPKIVFLSRFFVLLASITICFLLIPKYNGIGAGLSISSTYILLSSVDLIIYKKIAKSNLRDILILRKEDMRYYSKIYSSIRNLISFRGSTRK